MHLIYWDQGTDVYFWILVSTKHWLNWDKLTWEESNLYFLLNIFRHDFIVFCSVYVVHLCVPACRNCKYIVKFSLHIYSVLAHLQFGQCSEMLFVPFKNRYSKYKVCKKNHKNIVIRWIRTNRDMNKNCVKNQKWVTAGQRLVAQGGKALSTSTLCCTEPRQHGGR